MRKLSGYTYLLFFLCLLDLATTIWILKRPDTGEANLLMAPLLAHGVALLVTAKLTLTLLPLAFLEWVRRHRPVLARRALQLAIGAYVALYAVGIVRANRSQTIGQMESQANSDPLMAVVMSQTRANIAAQRAGGELPRRESWRGWASAALDEPAAPYAAVASLGRPVPTTL